MDQTSSMSPARTHHAGGDSTAMPLVIITILFFMWGMITPLNDVLISHLNSI